MPATTDMLRPAIQVDVAAAITKCEMRGKVYQTVRVQTEDGFDQVARVEGPAQQHNSCIVASQGKRYIRNRQHLLQVDENPPAISEEDVPLRSTSPVPDGETAQNVNPPPTPPSITPVVNTADPSENQIHQDFVST